MASTNVFNTLYGLRRAIDKSRTIIALRNAVRQYLHFRENGFAGLVIENQLDLDHVELSLKVLFEGESIDMSGTPAEINRLWNEKIVPRRRLLQSLIVDDHYRRLLASAIDGSVLNYEQAILETLSIQKQEQENAVKLARSKRRMQSLREQASSLGVKGYRKFDEEELVAAIRSTRRVQSLREQARLLEIKGYRRFDESTLVEAIKSEREKRRRENRQLRQQEYRQTQLLKKHQQKLNMQRLGLDAEADTNLALMLDEEGSRALHECIQKVSGFLYFKVWVLPEGTKWYKIGITNDPERRDGEQNVLPVPSETLKLIRTPSIEYARSLESAFRKALGQSNIKGAGNRELFHLRPKQAVAIVAIMSRFQAFMLLAGANVQ
jgi:hypothetical protein